MSSVFVIISQLFFVSNSYFLFSLMKQNINTADDIIDNANQAFTIPSRKNHFISTLTSDTDDFISLGTVRPESNVDETIPITHLLILRIIGFFQRNEVPLEEKVVIDGISIQLKNIWKGKLHSCGTRGASYEVRNVIIPNQNKKITDTKYLEVQSLRTLLITVFSWFQITNINAYVQLGYSLFNPNLTTYKHLRSTSVTEKFIVSICFIIITVGGDIYLWSCYFPIPILKE